MKKHWANLLAQVKNCMEIKLQQEEGQRGESACRYRRVFTKYYRQNASWRSSRVPSGRRDQWIRSWRGNPALKRAIVPRNDLPQLLLLAAFPASSTSIYTYTVLVKWADTYCNQVAVSVVVYTCGEWLMRFLGVNSCLLRWTSWRDRSLFVTIPTFSSNTRPRHKVNGTSKSELSARLNKWAAPLCCRVRRALTYHYINCGV